MATGVKTGRPAAYIASIRLRKKSDVIPQIHRKSDPIGFSLDTAVDVPPEPVFSTLARGYVDLGDSPDG